MPIPYYQRPQRVNREQWEDIRHHYEENIDPEDWEEYEDDALPVQDTVQDEDSHLESDYDERNGDIEPF